MSFTIPMWIFYGLGGVLILVVLALAILGAFFIYWFKDWRFM